MKAVLLTSALTGAGLLIYSVRSLFRQGEEQESDQKAIPEEVEEMTLEEASENWMGEEVLIQDIAVLWRESRQKRLSPLPRPSFRHEEIDRFFADMVEHRASVGGARRTVIVKILQMLDEEGDCPSVVRMNPLEAEKQFANDTFAMLATIPLYRHTLNVARRSVAKSGQEAVLADFLIVSLAHDLGKIPSYHDKVYATSDHPIISALIVNGIAEYASLPNRAGLDEIIRGHHLLKTDNTLTNMLKLCDHEARQEELATLLAAARERDRQQGPAKSDETPQAESGPGTGAGMPTSAPKLPPEEEREHPLGEITAEEPFHPVAQLVPAWFDADAILAALRKRINRLEETAEGPRWTAVSIGTGTVYVQPDGLWAALKEVSGSDPAVLASDANEEAKRNLLYTVVWELSRTKDAIATEFVTAHYYTTQTTVVTGSGKGITVLLIPFRAAVFAEKPSELEELKTAQLKKMVRDIRPKQKEAKKCVM